TEEGKRTQYVLYWNGAAAESLLEKIREYLVLKSFKARMGIIYYNSFFKGKTHHIISREEKEARQVFRNMISPNNKDNKFPDSGG
ncbi:unnamed protein product, partial [marine sediment metagenome]